MKNIIFLGCTLFILTSASAQSSVYHPLPDSNVYWHESAFWTVWSNPPCVVTDDYFVFVNGDTTIGLNPYHKIYKSGFISASCPPPGYYYYNDYVGAWRQDSALKQVYFVPEPDTIEYLMYDFNLTIGDTLASTYNWGNQNTVIGIDSVLVGTSFHKRFLLQQMNTGNSPDTNYALIEGVGSTLGLFNMIMVPFESGSQLICFGHNSQYYPASSGCPYTLGTEEIASHVSSITYSPNPFSSEITIQSGTPFTNATITIVNCFGQIVKVVEGASGSSVAISRDDLPPGLYFIEIIQDQQLLSTAKILIADE